MTPDDVIRQAARHWYELICNGEVQLDYPGFDRDLEDALGIERI